MGNGIRRSKDLRAKTRKYLVLTNERKKMSTKTTIRKRISLTAIGALVTGLLTVTGGSTSANASVYAHTNVTQAGGSTGIISALSASAVSMTSDGVLKLNIASSSVVISVSGGKITGVDGTSLTSAGVPAVAGSPVISVDGSNLSTNTGSVSQELALNGVNFKPTAAGTNMVIKLYGVTTTAATALATPSTALATTITVTVYAPGASGVFSAATSLLSIQAIGSSQATVADVPYEDTVSAGTEARINYLWKDALGTQLASTATTMAQVTSGACVVGTSAAGGTTPVATEVTSSGDFYLGVADATDGLAKTCTVAISWDGVVRGTKTVKFTGSPTKINWTAAYRGDDGASNTAAATQKGYVTVTDNAGNTLGGINVVADTTKYNAIISAASISNSGYTSYRASDTATSVRYPAAAGAVPSSLNYTCTSVGGDSEVVLKYTSSTGTSISSTPIPVSCTGGADKYTASLDKASYVPGDIATLTINAVDSKGRKVHDASALGASQSIVGSQMTAVQAPSSGDLFADGKITYKFQVGSTTGSYNMVVDLPAINSVSTTGATAQTIAYKIASSSTEVTNAEVLKSIVALIASINKQIQALQKLILARR